MFYHILFVDKRHKKKHKHSSDTSGSDSDEWIEKPSTSQETKDSASADSEVSEKDMWSGPVKVTEEKSREEEFEDYFEDMFL